MNQTTTTTTSTSSATSSSLIVVAPIRALITPLTLPFVERVFSASRHAFKVIRRIYVVRHPIVSRSIFDRISLRQYMLTRKQKSKNILFIKKSYEKDDKLWKNGFEAVVALSRPYFKHLQIHVRYL